MGRVITMQEGLTVQLECRNGSPLYKLIGKLGLSTREILRDSIESAWGASATLRLDLSEVHAVDLPGISWLTLADEQLRRQGGRLEILSMSGVVREALRMLWPATRGLLVAPLSQCSPGRG